MYKKNHSRPRVLHHLRFQAPSGAWNVSSWLRWTYGTWQKVNVQKVMDGWIDEFLQMYRINVWNELPYDRSLQSFI